MHALKALHCLSNVLHLSAHPCESGISIYLTYKSTLCSPGSLKIYNSDHQACLRNIFFRTKYAFLHINLLFQCQDLEITELLLYRALQPAPSQPFIAPPCSTADGLAMLQPLAARLAFGTTSERRQWACHLLQLASSHLSPSSSDNGQAHASNIQADSTVATHQPASPNQDVQQHPHQQQRVVLSSKNSISTAGNDSCASIMATALWLPRGERCMLLQCRLQWTAFPAPHRDLKSSPGKRQLIFARSAIQSTARWLVSLQSSLSLQRLQLSKAGDGAGAQAMAFSVDLRPSRSVSDDRGDVAGAGSSAVMLLASLLASSHQQV